MKINPEIYIEGTIIAFLQRFTQREADAKEIPWDTMRISLNNCVKQGTSYMTVLHRLMQPYYEMYFYGDQEICRSIPGPERVFMDSVIDADGEFCLWASSQNLEAAAEGWGDYMKRCNNDHVSFFFNILIRLISDSCHQDWEKLSDSLKEKLFQAEVCSDPKTDELYCILHALAMIMQQEWTLQKKEEMFIMLRDHWGFMKYVYSIMIRHIVGSRLPNWAALTNAVMQSNDNLPHLDIYYCGLVERMDSLGLDEKKFKKLDNARLKLLEKINRREPSETLYGLCDTIFPEEFQLMMRHRPPSYGELKEENALKDKLMAEMENQTRKLEQQLEEVTLTYKSAIEASIPVDYIVLRFQQIKRIDTAWAIYESLDRLLKRHPAWRKYDVIIHDVLEQRESDEEEKKQNLYADMKTAANKPAKAINIGEFNNHGTYNDYSEATFPSSPYIPHKNMPKIIEE